EGTTARAWSANDIAANMLTAGTIMLLAQLESPSITGTPTGPTAGGRKNTTELSTTPFLRGAIKAVRLGTASPRNVGHGGFLFYTYSGAHQPKTLYILVVGG
ncbi:hypothetical protein ACVGWD_06310, partial [Enterobacter asburiae]